MQRARRPPTGAESGARIARHTFSRAQHGFVSARQHVRSYLPLSIVAQVLTASRRGVAAEQSRDARLGARLDHAEVPRRSHATCPATSPRLRTREPRPFARRARGKRTAAQWASNGRRVGRELGAPAADAGAVRTASGWGATEYATPPPTSAFGKRRSLTTHTHCSPAAGTSLPWARRRPSICLWPLKK